MVLVKRLSQGHPLGNSAKLLQNSKNISVYESYVPKDNSGNECKKDEVISSGSESGRTFIIKPVDYGKISTKIISF